MVLAITLHNIPEGLAVGVAFGAVAAGLPSATLAGAMIFVVIEQLVPESQFENNTDIATAGAMIGFVLMMALDVGVG